MPQAAASPDATPTLATQVAARLRADILTCRLLPNARLRLDELRDRYGCGASPVREALMRLEGEGLVQLEQNRGFRVTPISREHLIDLTANRIEIESIALRWSLERGSVRWEAEVLAAFHRLSREQKLGAGEHGAVSEAWRHEHRAFHHALVAGCDSPVLLALREGLFDQAERYVALSVAYRTRPRDDVAEHRRLMEAVIARDLRRVLDLNRQHIQRTADKVRATLQAIAA